MNVRGQRVAVITGGSAGVGRAAAEEFAAAGYNVAILARGHPGLEGAAADVRAHGVRALALSVDVADADAVDRAAERVDRELGEVDVWVNCAMVSYISPFRDVTPEEFHQVTDVTYHGQVHGTMAALRRFRPRDRGVIVNVGSAMAYRGIPLQSAYCGAKAAIVGFTESIATELVHEKSNVEITMVQLPALNTPQFTWILTKMPKNPIPVPPIFVPRLAGRAVRFIAEHPRRNMWVGLPTAYTVLGNRVAPKLLDRYLGRTGVSAQQTDAHFTRLSPNLFESSGVDQGSTGPFTEQAHDCDPQLWLSRHRCSVAALAAGGALVAAAAVALARRG